MNQTKQLLAAVKRILKSRGLTYADCAQALDLSEASVKRLFAEQSFSLQRLERLCEWLQLEFADLVSAMHEQRPLVGELSEIQETEIAGDTELLLVAVCTLNHWRFDEILSHYQFDEPQLIRLLVRLDRLGLIELLPGNRIKLRIAANFRWRPGGPIQQFFQNYVKQDFFRSDFSSDHEQLLVINGMLSAANNARFQSRLRQLAEEFQELSRQDAALPLPQRFGTTAVLALRRWQYPRFSPYVRDN